MSQRLSPGSAPPGTAAPESGTGMVVSVAGARTASWAECSSSPLPCRACTRRELKTRLSRIAVIAPAEMPELTMIWNQFGNSLYS